ncbi:neck protein [Winogradskyella phage Peternella_1]|uniref:Neck protein n=1 Tax=Winogradskyella phage Peternella_1 TaxID=2745699 RepID=A0A8E4ZE46_9CAUD|nr:neck protein [Winogradskyella phage Peternella_1]QQV91566.1 neck protein [Winogradskyella phage Peternella_1]
MSQINKTPDFLGMAEQLKRDLQMDAEIQGMDFIHQNFIDEGWHGSTFEAWAPRKESTSYNLLRVTNYLFNSINVASSSVEQIVFEADAPYAEIHNSGGTLNIPITERSRKFFWMMFKVTGKEKWKWMALTKKERFSVKIDKRQFMGESDIFDKQWNDHVSNEIITRFKQL